MAALREGWTGVEQVEIHDGALESAYADAAAFGFSKLALLEAGMQGEAVASGTSYSVEHRIDHPERGVRWLGIRGDWDVRDDDAILTGVCIDITEQKSRQENATLLMREVEPRSEVA